MGIFFAFLALFSWGLGDFLIQRSTRKFGDWIALFFICAFGAIILFPFIYKDLGVLVSENKSLFILLLASVVVLFAALFDFEALRIGKISVVESVYALEVPITVGLAIGFLKEYLTFWQGLLVAFLLVGIFLVSIKSFHHLKHIRWEKGVLYAALATLGMGCVNFLFGVGARETSPLLINWFTSCFIAIVTLVYLIANAKMGELWKDLKERKLLVLSVSFFDNLAWISYAYSTLYIPIAIATSISESYIAMAALLGFIFNRERLGKHQWLGFVVVIITAVVLAGITEW